MLARQDRHRDFMLANQVVRHPDVVEIVHLDHEVIDAAFGGANSESDGVIAIIAMHEHRRDHVLAHPKLVLDAAAHAEQRVEAEGSIGVLLTHDAMPDSAGSGFEFTVHRAARMKWLFELHFGAVKYLDRIAIG